MKNNIFSRRLRHEMSESDYQITPELFSRYLLDKSKEKGVVGLAEHFRYENIRNFSNIRHELLTFLSGPTLESAMSASPSLTSLDIWKPWRRIWDTLRQNFIWRYSFCL